MITPRPTPDELEAICERTGMVLEGEMDDRAEDMLSLVAEVRALQAELARLEAEVKRVDQEADNASHNCTILNKCLDAAESRSTALAAENRRLREAMEKIAPADATAAADCWHRDRIMPALRRVER